MLLREDRVEKEREGRVEKEREGRVENEDIELTSSISDENADVMDSDVNTLCD